MNEEETTKIKTDDQGKAALKKDVSAAMLVKMEDEIKNLRNQIAMQNVTVTKIIKEEQDSIEIGAQATGRIKVYGTAGKKAEFAKKIADQLDLLEAAQPRMKKITGGE